MSDRAPIGALDDVLEIVVGFFLRGATDDADRRPYLDVAAALEGQALGLGDARGAGFGSLHRVEVHVRVADGEPASRLGAAGVHHERIPITKGTRRSFDGVKAIVSPFVVEALFTSPDALDDGPPLFALGVAGVVLLLGD